MDPHELRSAMGCFATGVTIVTSIGLDGQPVGLTANSFSSVSLDPPLVQFSLDRGGQSLDAFQGSGKFAVNVLREDQVELSNTFAARDSERFAGLAYATWVTGSPILEGALANFDCDTYASYDGGDHVIFVGRVLSMSCDMDSQPLLFFRGRYRTLSAPP